MNLFTLFLYSLYGFIIVRAVPNDDSDLIKEWNSFKTKFSKSYNSKTEEKRRFEIFKENNRKIDGHNERYRRGEESFEMGINQFGDLTDDEVIRLTTRIQYDDYLERYEKDKIDIFTIPTGFIAPKTLDWRKKGAVTPVKDQDDCYTCGFFSAIGALEGQNFIKNGKYIRLSEQYLICNAFKYGYKNCNQSFQKDSVFELAKEIGGVVSERSYPYENQAGKCKPLSDKDKYCKVAGYKKIPPGDENALKIAVAYIGPISVSFYTGNNSDFHLYTKGIFEGKSCIPGPRNHAALLVGYGREDGKDYWLVKNSWSTEFGMGGYIKMLRNANNRCSIASAASFPIVQSDY